MKSLQLLGTSVNQGYWDVGWAYIVTLYQTAS